MCLCVCSGIYFLIGLLATLFFLSSYIFWSDWGRTPKIERATMAGNERQLIVSTDLGWPNGLSIDFDEEKIYWADAQKWVADAL